MNPKNFHSFSRRAVVKALGASLAVTGAYSLVGCGSGGSGGGDDTGGGTDIEDQVNNSGFDQITTDVAGADWASGGTASLTTAFPPADPFQESLGTVCTTTSSYTLGPCYFNPDEYRQDISEGQPGIPMILVFKVVDATCQPIAGADVDIWHCDVGGFYSGDSAASSDSSSFNLGFCTANNSNALASRFFRGVQTTDANGLVYFKSCFPGWYPSRTSHIHFKIVRNGVQSLVSQFCYEDAMSNDIYLNHPDYTGQAKDTMNANDNVFGANYNDYAFYISQNNDKSMTAYKAIQLV